MGTRKKNKPVEPIVRVELPPVVEPAAVEPLERLRVAVLNRLAEKFENRKLKITITDLNAAVQLLKKAGAAAGEPQGEPEAGSGSTQEPKLPHAPTSDAPAGQPRTSWSPLTAKEGDGLFLPFSDGEPTVR